MSLLIPPPQRPSKRRSSTIKTNFFDSVIKSYEQMRDSLSYEEIRQRMLNDDIPSDVIEKFLASNTNHQKKIIESIEDFLPSPPKGNKSFYQMHKFE